METQEIRKTLGTLGGLSTRMERVIAALDQGDHCPRVQGPMKQVQCDRLHDRYDASCRRCPRMPDEPTRSAA